jgi:CRP-like cAMP-binding protein
MLAIGSEPRDFIRGEVLFKRDDESDAGFIVRRGAFMLEDGRGATMIANSGVLIGELGLLIPVKRATSATAMEQSTVIRIARSLFQRVLETDPAAARRLRDGFADRSREIMRDIQKIGSMLTG